MISTALTLALALTMQDAPQAAPVEVPKTALTCAKSPVQKTYGALPWLAYGCSDNSTVMLVAPGDSPIAPYRFLISLVDGQYSVAGQGTGDKAMSESAYANMKGMPQEQLQALSKQVNP